MKNLRLLAVLISFILLPLATWNLPAQGGPSLANYYTLIPETVIDAGYIPRGTNSDALTADLNGDGHQDLVVLGSDSPSTGSTATTFAAQPGRVYLGDGAGHFSQAPADLFPVDTLRTVHPRKTIFADFNKDGRTDMFIACHGWDAQPFPGEQNRLYLSRAEGGWRDATATLPQISDFTHSAAAGDVSGRGFIDIFAGNFNNVLPYFLQNNGVGQFSLTRANIPVLRRELLDNTFWYFAGMGLADLNKDALPEMIVLGNDQEADYKLPRTTILWNQFGAYVNSDSTQLPSPGPIPDSFIGLDVQSIDVNQDGLQDLVVVGTQSAPRYDGWFVQILINVGNRQFVDQTAARLASIDSFGGTPGVRQNVPWAKWVRPLDFNQDGAPDFSVEFLAGTGRLPQGQPLVWINDGTGHFSTLKVSDFAAPGNELRVGYGHFVPTRYGYSIITPRWFPSSGGPRLTGLLANKRKLPGVGR